MNAFIKIVTVLSVPLGLINTFGGIVAGIWLAILGEWGIIGYGIVAMFVSGIGLGLAMAPGLLLAVPAASLYEKGHRIGSYIFGFLGVLYQIAVLTVWCIAVLYFFVKQANADSIVPVLIWSYGVATGPIGWLAHKELQGDNEYSMIPTFFAQIAYLLVVIAVYFFRLPLFDVVIVFTVVMAMGLFVQMGLPRKLQRGQDYL